MNSEKPMTQTDRHDPQTATTADRPLGPALLRGLRSRCPNCGRGRMLHNYIKVNDHCASCNEALFHHRADDGPAYLTILLVGHIVAPMLAIVYKGFRPEPLVLFGIFATATLVLSLGLLPRLKGAVVAFQWARRMHGFDTTTAPQPGRTS
jgi:uncharacterized protein (DUF983 family)